VTDDRSLGPRAQRVSEIRCKGSGYGSGYLLSPSIILTAAHVIGELGKTLPVDQRIEVVPLGTQPRPAQLVWPPVQKWEELSLEHDIALLRVESDNFTETYGVLIPVGWEGLRTDQLLPVTAVGFPRLRRNTKDSSRDTEQIFGEVYPLNALRNREFEIRAVRHRDIEDADWRGFSGAALFAGRSLIGVV
jgi:hypothetical protein